MHPQATELAMQRFAFAELPDEEHAVRFADEVREQQGVDAVYVKSADAPPGSHYGKQYADYALLSRGRVLAVVEAKRKTGYYIIQVLIPLIAIVLMAWTVFWIDPSVVPWNLLYSPVPAVLSLRNFLYCAT